MPLGTVHALVEISNISLEKWKDLLGDLIPWTEEDLASLQTKNIPERRVQGIGKAKTRKMDAVMDFLWLAVRQFYDVLQREELPYLCLVHRKVYWTECPLCGETHLVSETPKEEEMFSSEETLWLIKALKKIVDKITSLKFLEKI